MPRKTDPYAPTKSQRQRRGRKLESRNARNAPHSDAALRKPRAYGNR